MLMEVKEMSNAQPMKGLDACESEPVEFHTVPNNVVYLLQVGQGSFRVHANTMIKSPYLKSLMNENDAAETKINVFIDRSETVFPAVLDFLRTGQLLVPKHLTFAQVQAEFNYFHVRPAPKDEMENFFTHHGSYCLLSCGEGRVSLFGIGTVWQSGNWTSLVPFLENRAVRNTHSAAAILVRLMVQNGWRVRGAKLPPVPVLLSSCLFELER